MNLGELGLAWPGHYLICDWPPAWRVVQHSTCNLLVKYARSKDIGKGFFLVRDFRSHHYESAKIYSKHWIYYLCVNWFHLCQQSNRNLSTVSLLIWSMISFQQSSWSGRDIMLSVMRTLTTIWRSQTQSVGCLLPVLQGWCECLSNGYDAEFQKISLKYRPLSFEFRRLH